jgi:hypothetical protein
VPAPKGANTGLIAGVAILVVLLVAGGTWVFINRDSTAAAGEIFLEPANEPGRDPFTTDIKPEPVNITTTVVGGRVGSVKASATTTSARSGSGGSDAPTTTASTATSTTAQSTQVASTSGNQPGLYGGTQNVARCDPAQMVSFLQANPDKANAWVQALNADTTLQWSGGKQVTVAQVSAYVGELTPLTLTADVRVTNHGFANGKPTPRQAVLQAGTAVLVDKYGVPRTKCACGNPLTKPVPVTTAPSYTGTPWPGWNPENVIVVQQSQTVIDDFTIVNIAGDGYLERPAGTTGFRDTFSDYTPEDVPVAQTVPPPSTTLDLPSSTTRRGTSTTSTTSTTRAPTTTMTQEEFCDVFRSISEKWRGDTALTDDERRRFIDDLGRLADSAPPEIEDDLRLFIGWVDEGLRSGNLDIFNVPADVLAASQAIDTHLSTNCGFTFGGD